MTAPKGHPDADLHPEASGEAKKTVEVQIDESVNIEQI